MAGVMRACAAQRRAPRLRAHIFHEERCAAASERQLSPPASAAMLRHTCQRDAFFFFQRAAR